MKRLRKICIACVLACCLALGCFVALSPKGEKASASTAEGISFPAADHRYTAESLFTEVPYSMEAYVKIPAAYKTQRAGVIFGSYLGNGDVGISLEVQDNVPRFFYLHSDNSKSDYKFNLTDGASDQYDGKGTFVLDDKSSPFLSGGKLSLPSDAWVHIAMTLDVTAKRLNLYLNGVPTAHFESIALTGTTGTLSDLPTQKFMVGGDQRSGNAQYFKGSVKMVGAYSDVRTAIEIAADYARISGGMMMPAAPDLDMLVGYDLTQTYPTFLEDKSGNGNDLIASGAAKPATVDFSNTVAGHYFPTGAQLSVPDGTITAQPKTIEAVFRLPKTYAPGGANAGTRGGVIFGNYTDARTNAMIQLEIRDKGVPALFFCDQTNNNGIWCTFTFNAEGEHKEGGNVVANKKIVPIGSDYEVGGRNKTGAINVATGDWVHLAMVHDTSAQTIKLYLDGTLIGLMSGVKANNTALTGALSRLEYVPTGTYFVGSDSRTGQNFKGDIKSISVYSDVRTENEIYKDFLRKDGDAFAGDGLMCAYDFTRNNPDMYEDMSGNGKNLVYTGSKLYATAGDKAAGEGMSFSHEETTAVVKAFDSFPKTIEAEVMLPVNLIEKDDRGGVIIGNYEDGFISKAGCFGLEEKAGKLRFFAIDDDGVTIDKSVSAELRTGKWEKLTVTIDNNTVTVYVNGVKSGSQTFSGTLTKALTRPVMIGGDYRKSNGGSNEGNGQYFKGMIRNVAIFKDVRTDAEIIADMNGVSASADNIMALYDMSNVASSVVSDLTGNGYDVKHEMLWQSKGLELSPSDYAYSFAVVGDTQMFNYKHSERLKGIYEWIAENKTAKKIEAVFQLGDITEANIVEEWENAVAATRPLENAGIQYSMVRGNHDSNDRFDAYYGGNAAYASQLGGHYKVYSNSYQTRKIGATDYLFLTLDYGATDDVLAWASTVIKSHPTHRVIITTHAYTFRDGTTLSTGDAANPAQGNDSANCGQEMWEKLVSKHGNIYLVMSGHDPYDNIAYFKSTGNHGNEVMQMLIDPQSTDTWTAGSGMVAMLYFNEDGTQMSVEYVSTVRANMGVEKCYFKENNQFTLGMDGGEVSVGHNYQEIAAASVLKDTANCAHGNEYYKTCACGEVSPLDTFFDGAIDLTKHSFTVYEQSDDATCQANAKETAVCDSCHEKTHTRDIPNSKAEHRFEHYEITVPATCTSNAKETSVCEDCHVAKVTRQIENSINPDVHVFTEYVPNGDAACTSHGTETAECDMCHSISDTRNAAEGAHGHDWNDGEVTTQPTVEANGEKTFTCEVCGETRTEEIDKLAPPADTVPPADNKGGCSKESLALALTTLAALVACAFVLKK